MRRVSAAEQNKPLQPFSSAMACGQASKARFPKAFAVMGCAGRALVVSQRRSCKPKPSRRPSTWFASVRCCKGQLLDSRLPRDTQRVSRRGEESPEKLAKTTEMCLPERKRVRKTLYVKP